MTCVTPQNSRLTATDVIELIGTPDAPLIVDVRTDQDFADDPLLLPTSQRMSHLDVAHWQPERDDILVICQRGLKLSLGAAALLRARGFNAGIIEGGTLAFRDAGLPRIDPAVLPASKMWVVQDTPDHAAAFAVWTVKRFMMPYAHILAVPAPDMTAVADKFNARIMPSDPVTFLTELGLDRLLGDLIPELPTLVLNGALQGQDAVQAFDKTAPIFDALLAGVRMRSKPAGGDQ